MYPILRHRREETYIQREFYSSAIGKTLMFTPSFGFFLVMFVFIHLKQKNIACSYRTVWSSVAGFSVLWQTAQKTCCLYMWMEIAARHADVSIMSKNQAREQKLIFLFIL